MCGTVQRMHAWTISPLMCAGWCENEEVCLVPKPNSKAACLEAPMYWPEPPPEDAIAAYSDSMLSVIMTLADIRTPGYGARLGEYWLNGYFDGEETDELRDPAT